MPGPCPLDITRQREVKPFESASTREILRFADLKTITSTPDILGMHAFRFRRLWAGKNLVRLHGANPQQEISGAFQPTRLKGGRPGYMVPRILLSISSAAAVHLIRSACSPLSGPHHVDSCTPDTLCCPFSHLSLVSPRTVIVPNWVLAEPEPMYEGHG
ncbi:hypothetical protein CIHG_07361 [Coccidioides immitis H538.4]|uniref:Uncharacterized protein n=1 Tax=Coccidioides immitis H538.4 TaxID=396776 RepID=A0A0J8RZI3_COCIT|nr:hypothetical protein CIHG_07361 [Coccidioides immitis H538.4]